MRDPAPQLAATSVLVDAGTAAAVLGTTPEAVIRGIEAGRLVAFDLSAAGEDRPAWRIWSRSLVGRGGDSESPVVAVLEQICGHQLAIPTSKLCLRAGLSRPTVMRLVQSHALLQWDHAVSNQNVAWITRDSLERLLAQRSSFNPSGASFSEKRDDLSD